MGVDIPGIGRLELLFEENVGIPQQLADAAQQSAQRSTPAGDRLAQSSEASALRARVAVRLSA